MLQSYIQRIPEIHADVIRIIHDIVSTCDTATCDDLHICLCKMVAFMQTMYAQVYDLKKINLHSNPEVISLFSKLQITESHPGLQEYLNFYKQILSFKTEIVISIPTEKDAEKLKIAKKPAKEKTPACEMHEYYKTPASEMHEHYKTPASEMHEYYKTPINEQTKHNEDKKTSEGSFTKKKMTTFVNVVEGQIESMISACISDNQEKITESLTNLEGMEFNDGDKKFLRDKYGFVLPMLSTKMSNAENKKMLDELINLLNN
jgi:hypothetical protein